MLVGIEVPGSLEAASEEQSSVSIVRAVLVMSLDRPTTVLDTLAAPSSLHTFSLAALLLSTGVPRCTLPDARTVQMLPKWGMLKGDALPVGICYTIHASYLLVAFFSLVAAVLDARIGPSSGL